LYQILGKSLLVQKLLAENSECGSGLNALDARLSQSANGLSRNGVWQHEPDVALRFAFVSLQNSPLFLSSRRTKFHELRFVPETRPLAAMLVRLQHTDVTNCSNAKYC
jgi:hypothetical protein